MSGAPVVIECASPLADSMLSMGSAPLLRVAQSLAPTIRRIAASTEPLSPEVIRIAEAAARQAVHFFHLYERAKAWEESLGAQRSREENPGSLL